MRPLLGTWPAAPAVISAQDLPPRALRKACSNRGQEGLAARSIQRLAGWREPCPRKPGRASGLAARSRPAVVTASTGVLGYHQRFYCTLPEATGPALEPRCTEDNALLAILFCESRKPASGGQRFEGWGRVAAVPQPDFTSFGTYVFVLTA